MHRLIDFHTTSDKIYPHIACVFFSSDDIIIHTIRIDFFFLVVIETWKWNGEQEEIAT